MPNLFVLNVETQPNESQAIFRLSDAQGVHLAAHQVPVTGKNAFQWAGLFNTREHVSRHAGHLRPDNQSEPLTAENLLAQLGEFLGSEVLGKDIITQLIYGISILGLTQLIANLMSERNPLK
ncbi:MAG: hypothetical protein ABFS56_29155 [Pseudomonadota bacterium]